MLVAASQALLFRASVLAPNVNPPDVWPPSWSWTTSPLRERTLALLLRHRGHLVREADGVTAAVRELRADAFDVIVTDLRMPDGVGLDVLHTAKTHCPDANVILLTAYPAWESAKEAMRLGAFDYFEKGQEPEGLFRRIDSALEEQASRRRIELASPATASRTARVARGGASLSHRPVRGHARLDGAPGGPRPRRGERDPRRRDRAIDGRRARGRRHRESGDG
jgi:two-component system response regulator PilR (NtrC family)